MKQLELDYSPQEIAKATAKLYESHAVVVSSNGGHVVEGKSLLAVCGLGVDTTNTSTEVKRQIARHDFVEDVDFISCIDARYNKPGRKPVLYYFTLNAANHVLLAAMTTEGKVARQDAIDTKTSTGYDDDLGIIVGMVNAIQETRRTQDEHAKRLEVLEAKAVDGSDYVTIRGYCSIKGLPITEQAAAVRGRRASTICRARGLEIGTASSQIFGQVNTYPLDVLDAVFS